MGLESLTGTDFAGAGISNRKAKILTSVRTEAAKTCVSSEGIATSELTIADTKEVTTTRETNFVSLGQKPVSLTGGED